MAMKKTSEEACDTGECQSCGATIKQGVCMGCMMSPDKCVCDKDVTSSVYPE